MQNRVRDVKRKVIEQVIAGLGLKDRKNKVLYEGKHIS